MAGRLRLLPRSLDPLEDESIHGYLLRLAHRFGAAPLEIAVRTGLVDPVPARNRIPVRLLHDLDERRLDAFARATRLTRDEARGLLTAPLGERYGPLSARLLAEFRTPKGMVHNNRWILTRTTRYCPRCLSGDGTEIEERHGGCWRRAWRLPPVFACLRHQRLLLSGCPRCGQDVNAARTGSLIARASEAGLHPAQCRATVPSTRAMCGAGLAGQEDRLPRAPSAVAALLRLQHHFDGLLDPDGPKLVGSFGWLIPAAQYFIDLRALSALIFMTWPRARALADTEALAVLVDREAEERHAEFAKSRAEAKAGRRRQASHHYSDPAADPAVAGAVLGIAARLLSAPDENETHELMAPIIDGAKERNFSMSYQFRRLSGTSYPLQAILLTSRQDRGAFQRMGQRIEGQGFRRLAAAQRLT
ncbi:TniQ family protein [Streptomyces phaeolivaceus]|uniref:TniQ family protein n=1 Tax=Streptomyces phaeolivaceus TaxID=2653200 RepID=A0A5P8K701_9ACTN|nr:TniQ family protein [Streptomyces phaeolivaceus]QFQ98377.1 TniQ family protein [Streptomyces phaeolivaceus]